jgi:poly(A) polymerase
MNSFAGQRGALALTIAKRLVEKGKIAYFAGGCVRDFLMNVAPHDFDIATDARPEEVESFFPKTVPVGRQFGVILVVDSGETFEVATFRREGGYADGRHPAYVAFTEPEEDAQRRDFTVNGLFYDPANGGVLDFVRGQSDIRDKIIRAIGDPTKRFDEDKLRILRAVRFASTLDFVIEKQTWDAVTAMAHQIRCVSPERIRDEVVKILTRGRAGRGLGLLSESGLLREILPEVEAMRNVRQPEAFHPEGDVFEHTQALLNRLENPTPVLALSALLHDVGKPNTYAVRNDKITFYEHAGIGAQMARRIMKRLRFSNDEIDQVAVCVENHMAFADVQRMRSGKLKRLMARPTFGDELELHRIDCEASHGMLQNFHFLKEKIKEFEREELKPKPFVNGHDLLELGMIAGPSMKPLLEEIYDAQLEGNIRTREEALAYAKNRIADKPV